MSALQQPRRALVVYGSETGNAQDVAEEMGRIAERLRFDTHVAELNAIKRLPHQLLQYHVVLIAISTTGQGDLPPNSQDFWKAIRRKALPTGCLQPMRFASFGLGDSSYPKYNWAHRKLYNRLVQLGAQPICDRGESDEQHEQGIDGSFLPWSTKLRQRLLEAYPLPDNVEPIPENVLLDPKWLLEIADKASATANIHETNGQSSDVPPPDLLDLPDGLTAKIASNERVTPSTHWQDVRHIKFEIPQVKPYAPGDVLTIYPKNFPSDVSQFLECMDWTSMADVPLRFIPSSPSTSSTNLPIPTLGAETTITLRQLLTNHLDILSIPRRSFFAQLAHYTTHEQHKERLLEFTSTDPDSIQELYNYTTRPRRSILEVLPDFTSVKIPWQRACSIIPVMRGRQFSIASAMNPTAEMEKKTKVELLIAIVKYKTIIRRIRQGVATRYIASLTPGQKITVTLSKGGLGVRKDEIDRPIIMVGPGTGVAPMRSLIYQRMLWRQELEQTQNEHMQEKDQVKDLLFFGCRNAESDYFFKDEWAQLQSNGVPLDVFVAFSRDQKEKVYVQDLLRQQRALVFSHLYHKSGIMYVCGSSGKMPQAIREALIEVFQNPGSMEREAAEAYLASMEKAGRYRQETW